MIQLSRRVQKAFKGTFASSSRTPAQLHNYNNTNIVTTDSGPTPQHSTNLPPSTLPEHQHQRESKQKQPQKQEQQQQSSSTQSSTEEMTTQPLHIVPSNEVQLPQKIETVEIMRPDTGRATVADPSSERPNWGNLNKKKKTHAYYNEAFAVREAGPKIPDSVGIMVEFKTNVILENEFDFIKSLSQFIAKRYSRTEESVALTVDHSACMIMGGTFDGCYFLTITSPTLISPTCNKRNVALISEWIHQTLGVPAPRGYIRFHQPDIANYAVGGTTCLDLIERERNVVSRAGQTSSGYKENKPKKFSIMRKAVPQRPQTSTDGEAQPPHYAASILSGRTTSHSTYSLEKPHLALKPRRSMFNLFNRSQQIPAN